MVASRIVDLGRERLITSHDPFDCEPSGVLSREGDRASVVEQLGSFIYFCLNASIATIYNLNRQLLCVF